MVQAVGVHDYLHRRGFCAVRDVLVSATNPFGLGIFLALGVVVFGMGLVLSYVGTKLGPSHDREQVAIIEASIKQPLSFLLSESGQLQIAEARASGDKALGFVLISLGSFVLTVAGVFGLFGFWPLTLLGAGLALPGVILRFRPALGGRNQRPYPL